VNFNAPARSFVPQGNTQNTYKPKPIQDAWKKLSEGLQNNIDAFESQAPLSQETLFASAGNPEDEPKTIQSKANRWNYEINKPNGFQVIQVLQKYLAISMADGLLLIDQKRAYQRILYDQFIDNLSKEKWSGPTTPFP
jgi:DNA mismatch repair protein MutL